MGQKGGRKGVRLGDRCGEGNRGMVYSVQLEWARVVWIRFEQYPRCKNIPARVSKSWSRLHKRRKQKTVCCGRRGRKGSGVGVGVSRFKEGGIGKSVVKVVNGK